MAIHAYIRTDKHACMHTDIHIYIYIILKEKVEMAIRSLKDRKAAGRNNVSAELIKKTVANK